MQVSGNLQGSASVIADAVVSLRANVQINGDSIRTKAAIEPKGKIIEKFNLEDSVSAQCSNSLYEIQGNWAYAVDFTYSFDTNSTHKGDTKEIAGNYFDLKPLNTFCSPQHKL